MAELLEADEVIFAPLASVLSAFGCLVSPVRIELAHTHLEHEELPRTSVGKIRELSLSAS